MTFLELILKFQRNARYRTGFTAEDIRKMITENNIFRDEMGDEMFSENPDFECYKYSVKESVKAYTRNKENMIKAHKALIREINNKTNWNFSDDFFPPIPISNTFERLMYIAKFLQDSQRSINELEDVLWVSRRTIEDDLKKLRGNDDDPIQICGKKFIIKDTERKSGTLSFQSTAHPFFLTYNLTQVISVLKGLKLMSENSAYSYYSASAAADIWNQLSDYAKNRILTVGKDLLKEDIEWYKSLEKDKDFAFLTEYDCSRTAGCGTLLDCLKNQKSCYIEYADRKAGEFIAIKKVVSFENNSVTAETENGMETFELEKVLKSSYYEEKLI